MFVQMVTMLIIIQTPAKNAIQFASHALNLKSAQNVSQISF